MAGRKVTIKAIEVVQCVRAGMDEAALMERFNISARGLQSLLSQLVSAGILKEPEIQERPSATAGSVILDVNKAELPVPAAGKRIIDAAEALSCIRSGMAEAALMKRFNISAKGVQSLTKKLVAAGAITAAEIEERMSTADSAVQVDEQIKEELPSGMFSTQAEYDSLVLGIKSGMDYRDIIETFELSSTALRNLIVEFKRRHLISDHDLNPGTVQQERELTIRHRITGDPIYSGEARSLGALVERAVSEMEDLAYADLANADLSKRELSGAHLMRANLTRANLVGTDLTGANLNGATLVSADMYGAILYKVNLSDANLSESNMTMVNGVWAFMPKANISEANLTRADFSGANLAGAVLFGAILKGASFAGAYLGNTSLDEAR